jgi:predicted Zn-dependent peptidase
VDDVRDFFKTYYAPNNAVVALVGDLNTAETIAKVKKYFGDIPKQEAPKPADVTEPVQEAERRLKMEDKLARLTQLVMVYKVPPASHADTPAINVMARIVGGGESSRLYQKLVKEKELALSAGVFPLERAGPGLLYVSATVRPGKTPEEVEGMISEELARLHAAPVTADELKRAHAAIRRTAISGHEGSLGRAVRLADDAVLFNDPGRLNTMPQKQLDVTAADVERVAKAYLRTVNRTVVTTVPAAPAGGSK